MKIKLSKTWILGEDEAILTSIVFRWVEATIPLCSNGTLRQVVGRSRFGVPKAPFDRVFGMQPPPKKEMASIWKMIWKTIPISPPKEDLVLFFLFGGVFVGR